MRTATFAVLVVLLTVVMVLPASAADYCRNGVNKSIPDNVPSGISDTVIVSGVPPGDVVLGIAVKIDSIIHTYVGDFRMTLTHNGITKTLMNRPGTGTFGSGGNNFTGTVLVDSATRRIDSIASTGTPPNGPPYTGYFRPDSGGAPNIVASSLAPFIGSDPNGEWILAISDNEAQDTGSLLAWCMQLVTGPSTGVEPVGNEVPGTFKLDQNYPNPFNPSTSIQFALPVASTVTLKVYDVMGQEIATLLNGHLNAGTFNASWNGTSSTGVSMASGVYFYRLTAEGTSSSEAFTSLKKMVLMK